MVLTGFSLEISFQKLGAVEGINVMIQSEQNAAYNVGLDASLYFSITSNALLQPNGSSSRFRSGSVRTPCFLL
jgi:hypothetical protein